MSGTLNDRRLIAWITLCCLLTASVAPASAQEKAQEEAPQDNAYKITVGFVTKMEDKRAIGMINVDGKAVKVMLDTGAGAGVILFKDIAERLELDIEPLENQPGHFITKAGVGIDANQTLSDPIDIRVVDSPHFDKFMGVIGWNILDSFVWELDVPRGRQITYDELPEEAKDWLSFPFETSELGNMYFTIEEDGEPVQIHFDTGSTGGISMSPQRWTKWRKDAAPEWITLEGGYSPANKDGFFVQETAVAKGLDLGGLKFDVVLIEEEFANIRSDGQSVDVPLLMGMDALSRRRVLIDGPGGRIYFGPLEKPADELPSINRAQATFIPSSKDGGRQVAHVLEGGVAHRAGLRDGDEVVMINGHIADNWLTNEDARPRTAFNRKPGTPVRLLIERDGERLTISFKLGRSPLDIDPEDEPAS
jgi:membrane-associated protease RseP (regulator of RpoE activity)